MASNISAANMLSSYALFNATDIKQFIIDQLKANPDSPFKDVDYLGSNFNALIDVIAVMLQQILFSYSVNASETSFSTALLYENMARIVSLLNYKSAGKQTSILPVRLTVERDSSSDKNNICDVVIPKFLKTSYNYPFVLLNEEQVHIQKGQDTAVLDTIMYQGQVNESEIFLANGDEFELFTINDSHIRSGDGSFISDNFFTVYVSEPDNNGKDIWIEYEECSSLFLENSTSKKYERRFTEDFGYEIKFGNGTYGKKLEKGNKVIIYYLVSSGEDAIIGNNLMKGKQITVYNSSNYEIIKNSITSSSTAIDLSKISIQNTGPSTPISYPESVASIRKNAPRAFSSQGRLFSLGDYETFINKNFATYAKDIYVCRNEDYIKNYLNYYYEIGMSAPQTDSRLNIAQVEFMTAVNFNNIYCFLLPAINTLINGKVPNYLNTALKRQIVNKAKPAMGTNHNLVILDPIYKAFTFGSYNIDDTNFNKKQLNNTLVLIRNENSKYSYNFIKEYCNQLLTTYFNNLRLGSTIDTAVIGRLISTCPGVKKFYIKDENGNTDDKINLFVWNPLYSNEDNIITSQSYKCKEFEYPYFYDLNNLITKIEVTDE